jgi:hypothetical protein
MEPKGANEIAVRSELGTDPAYQAGMEIAILDDPHPAYADAKPTQRHGAIYDVIPARPVFSTRPESGTRKR